MSIINNIRYYHSSFLPPQKNAAFTWCPSFLEHYDEKIICKFATKHGRMETTQMRSKLMEFVAKGDETLLKLMYSVAEEYSN